MVAERQDGQASESSVVAAAGGASRPLLDAALWQQLSSATTREELAHAWLALQCAMVTGVNRALLELADAASETFRLAARWPATDTADPAELNAIAEAAKSRARGVARDDGASAFIGYPLKSDSRLVGVIALEIEARPPADLRLVMRQLQWGSGWMRNALGADSPGESQPLATVPQEGLVTVLEQVANSLEHDGFRTAARAVATETATRLGCERVSIGFVTGRSVHPHAVSHSAEFGKRSNLIRAIAAAMDEAVDQREPLTFPELDTDIARTIRAHAALAKQNRGLAVCTVPFVVDGRVAGAWTFERSDERPFGREDVRLCSQLAAVVGPILDLERREERWLGRKVADAAKRQAERLLGPGFVGRKLLTATAVAATVFFAVYSTTFRVSADASLEGRIQRVVAAPMDGYIGEVHARAGDLVAAGDLLVALDDTDLRLEQIKWETRKAQLERSRQDALARHERAESRIYKAQGDQADAELELLGEQLSRISIRAPFDGVVVSGDLSQSLGAPVERGEILMEVAPLDEYRVALSVDERDIAYVAVGQTGELILPSVPDVAHAFTVTKITPVASAEAGQNTFRVEADLLVPSDAMRPGMQGTGKIEAGRQKLIWIWTRRFTEWLRIWVWSWWY